MDRRTAKNYDALLGEIASKPHLGFRTEMLWPKAEALGMSAQQLATAVSTFRVDGLLKPIHHPEAPHVDFGLFNISDRGVRFLAHEGGYQRKRRFESYEKTNVKFTWLRHWVWFYTAAVSLLVNFYFILKYLLKWL